MEFLAYILFAAVAWYVFSQIKSGYKASGEHGGKKYCMTCGSDTLPKTTTKGSMGIEIVLWLCFLLPGLIYSIWRLSSRHDACAACGSATLVPIGTPTAQMQAKQADINNSKKCPDCAEMVLPEARICKHCKHEFFTAQQSL